MLKSLSTLLGSQSLLSKAYLEPQNQTLRGAANNTGVYIVGAVSYDYLQNDDKYAQTAAQEFNLITAEDECKMANIAKSYDDLDFSKCKYMIENAKNNK